MPGLSDVLRIPVILIPERRYARLPTPSTPDAAGLDLCAANDEPVILQAGQRAALPTGLIMAIPQGFEGQVRPRSGLALKHGITVLNSPGTIDADFRGELGVILINHGQEPFTIEPGMRIAQLVIAPCLYTEWQPVSALPRTARNTGGFGHTGY